MVQNFAAIGRWSSEISLSLPDGLTNIPVGLRQN